MDYKLFRNMLAPYLVDHMSGIQEFKKKIASTSVEDAFDKKFLTVLNSIISCLETNEAIKSLALHLLDEADFFSDTEIHKTTKSKYLDKILSDSDYIEHTKTFNLSVIQTYVERIIHKQLYEINIKIEENQRSLNKLEVASGKMREEVQNQNQLQQTGQAQTAQLMRQPQRLAQPHQIQNITQKIRPEQPSQAVGSSQPQPHNLLKPQEEPTSVSSSFLLVEMDQQQCAITYSDIVEILKFDKPVSEKVLKIATLPYNKLVGFTGSSVLRKVNDFQMDKKQYLNNMNATLPNQEDKRFAVIINRGATHHILFVDYIVYAEPVNGEELGDYVKTVEGKYKLING